VHICDASFNADVLVDYKLPGEGDLEVARQIEILKGMAFDGYVVFEWPRRWVDRLAAPETSLPAAAKFLRDLLNEKQPILTAYKGDKNAPKFITPGKVPAAS
jgi:sugar phosphate isomerase/epimerase